MRTSGGALNGSYGKTARQVKSIVNRHLAPVGEAASAEAKAFIGISGTQTIWQGAWRSGDGLRTRTGPGRGRIDTGEMQRAIDFRVTHGAGIGIDIGWIRNYQDYFGAQETGFHAGGVRPDQWVEGMGMFQHLRVYTRIRVTEAAGDIMEEIQRGL